MREFHCSLCRSAKHRSPDELRQMAFDHLASAKRSRHAKMRQYNARRATRYFAHAQELEAKAVAA